MCGVWVGVQRQCVPDDDELYMSPMVNVSRAFWLLRELFARDTYGGELDGPLRFCVYECVCECV